VADPKASIRDKALSLGFDAIGFAGPDLGAQARQGLHDFLAASYHGDMGWLEARADQRADPATLWPDVKSVVVVGLNYGPERDPLEALERKSDGAISVYAEGRDYHDVLKKRLRALARWIGETYRSEVKLFVDTAPVMEKRLGQLSGLGWQGKHTNLVSREFGSWLFLGEIYTALDLAPDPAEQDHCGECSRCLDICPTAAFVGPYKLDARRCISYLTIEHKGPIPLEFRAAIGNRIYGCDDCLAVCPWNKFASVTGVDEFHPPHPGPLPQRGEGAGGATEHPLPSRERAGVRGLTRLAGLDDPAFRQLFAGSPVKRIGRDRFIRNVLIAMGNSGDAALAATALALLDDSSALVRGAAIWALSRLDHGRWTEERAQREPAETDPELRREWQHCV
jgi:epoxyqueuosine reductase